MLPYIQLAVIDSLVLEYALPGVVNTWLKQQSVRKLLGLPACRN